MWFPKHIFWGGVEHLFQQEQKINTGYWKGNTKHYGVCHPIEEGGGGGGGLLQYSWSSYAPPYRPPCFSQRNNAIGSMLFKAALFSQYSSLYTQMFFMLLMCKSLLLTLRFVIWISTVARTFGHKGEHTFQSWVTPSLDGINDMNICTWDFRLHLSSRRDFLLACFVE